MSLCLDKGCSWTSLASRMQFSLWPLTPWYSYHCTEYTKSLVWECSWIKLTTEERVEEASTVAVAREANSFMHSNGDGHKSGLGTSRLDAFSSRVHNPPKLTRITALGGCRLQLYGRFCWQGSQRSVAGEWRSEATCVGHIHKNSYLLRVGDVPGVVARRQLL